MLEELKRIDVKVYESIKSELRRQRQHLELIASENFTARAVLEALLQKDQDEGVTNLDDPRILKVSPFDTMGTPVELLKTFGGRDGFETAVHELQTALYQEAI